MNLGKTQMAILRASIGGAMVSCTKPSQYNAALRLADRGYLDRDLSRCGSRRFVGNAAGEAEVNAKEPRP